MCLIFFTCFSVLDFFLFSVLFVFLPLQGSWTAEARLSRRLKTALPEVWGAVWKMEGSTAAARSRMKHVYVGIQLLSDNIHRPGRPSWLLWQQPGQGSGVKVALSHLLERHPPLGESVTSTFFTLRLRFTLGSGLCRRRCTRPLAAYRHLRLQTSRLLRHLQPRRYQHPQL